MLLLVGLFAVFRTTLSSVSRFELITAGTLNGDGSDFLVTLFWDDETYACTFNPHLTPSGTALTCDNPTASPTPSGTYTRFYAKFEYQGSTAIHFKSLTVTDDADNYYEMDTFCIR